MPNISRTVDLIGDVDGSNTVFTFAGTRSVVSVDFATYDGTAHRKTDPDGFAVNLTTRTITFNFAPTIANYPPWAQVVEFVPDGTGTGSLVTSFGGEDIRITKGQDFTAPIAFAQDNGDPDDLTDAQDILVTVKRQLIDSFPIIIAKSLLTTGIAITSAVDGLAEISLVPADTVDLSEGRYMYDKWIVGSTGLYLPRGYGAFIVEGRATVIG